MARIKKSGPEQYVPEVFYSFKNEYGTDQTAAAKPAFPLDYLIVNVSSGSPQDPTPMFTSALPGANVSGRVDVK
jgi:nuclear protein localization family protein 4